MSILIITKTILKKLLILYPTTFCKAKIKKKFFKVKIEGLFNIYYLY